MRQTQAFKKLVHYAMGTLACLTVLLFLAGCGGGTIAGGGTPAVTQTIGSGGGEIVNGNATLLIQANSSSTTSTTALYSVQQTTSYPSDVRVVSGTAYSFTSSAATLSGTARISIRYNGGALPKGAQESSLQLYEVVSGAWTLVSDSSLDTNNKVVSGTAATLGVYAVLASTIVTTTTGGGTGSNRATALLFLSNTGLSNAGTLYATSVGSSTALPISTTGGQGSESIGHAAFAPDAKSLVYDTQSTVGDLLVVAAPDGSSVQQLLIGGLRPDNQQARPRTPSYSSDGKTIVFIYDVTGSDQIYTIKPDGTGMTQITRNFNGFNADNPAYTKSGQIRFTSTTTSGGTTLQYNLVNADGTGLTSTPTFGPTVVPWYTYSPDGSKIVYVAQSSNKYDIFTINADGSSPTQITKLAAPSIGTARFSTDGTQIIFDATTTSNSTNSLYTIKVDGTGQQALTTAVSGSLTLLDAH